MAAGYISPSPFTLESLVAFRQWSAEQRLAKRKSVALKPAQKSERVQVSNSKFLKTSE